MNPRIARLWKRWRKAQQWLVAQAMFTILRVLRLLPARAGLAAAEALARTLGPLSPRHGLALQNLRHAYPEKPEIWVRRIARANWGQMGRLAAEYVFLDEIFDYDPTRTEPGIVEVEGVEIFEELRERKGPFIFFTAHLGCFELLPICAATFGLEVTALFRPPNNRYIAREVLSTRRTRGGHLVPSKAGAAWSLVGALDSDGSVGMLVDQKFAKGVPTTFFGRDCRTNPLLAKLARQFDCEVYPARALRLPNGRYRLELMPRLDLPRDATGAVDVAATCQALNDVVESWVRDYPDQWMWFHRRWQT
ncbi:lipid A biosynthesis lauroyl acyltransferase [Mangrovibrevibacter kandeliae]|uniref:lipid A biosynthesis lauroyl acyltransferase n=1 Tax=Mangrovibrevibacter kandeliae TaxID=2968473 RepID=UPI0021183F8B|nr:lipid A biosynthesis lauroyl acyltransferase [Aurantimonas sp. CSK15Z-1]MCQ8781313.1 lipid A biosynthesis lauroyl acyltransferase [Aurantimonas sp. CSK15Z-1]